MISVFGDEGSSRLHASYGLLAIATAHLELLGKLVEEALRALGGTNAEALHAKVLFHEGRRTKSFPEISHSQAMEVCRTIFEKLALLEMFFFFARIDRAEAPITMHVPFVRDTASNSVVRSRITLQHLQVFAYTASSGAAADELKAHKIEQLIVDHNQTKISWFNARRQIQTLISGIKGDGTIGPWPTVLPQKSNEHAGLQIADLLTYFATKQYLDARYGLPLLPLAGRIRYLEFRFDPQVFGPINA